jgi:hypothetical protein
MRLILHKTLDRKKRAEFFGLCEFLLTLNILGPSSRSPDFCASFEEKQSTTLDRVMSGLHEQPSGSKARQMSRSKRDEHYASSSLAETPS